MVQYGVLHLLPVQVLLAPIGQSNLPADGPHLFCEATPVILHLLFQDVPGVVLLVLVHVEDPCHQADLLRPHTVLEPQKPGLGS